MLSRKLVSIGCVLCMALTCLGQGTGTIRYEVWDGIGGTVVTDLTNNPAFPGSPSWDDELTLFETPTNIADNFGGRVYGWLHPDTTGDYTFYIASDDASSLYLSTTESADDAVLIALEDSWAGPRAWSNGAEMSAPISLVAGQAYYIEALYKEGGGGDNLAVGWAMSSDMNDITVIDGAFLSPAPQNPNVLKARIVAPANGAVEVGVDAILEWTAGPTATSHVVYLSADATIDEADMLVETTDTNAVPVLEPGTTYSWRVDEVDADGVHEGYVWSFTVISNQAHYPMPADGGLYRIGLDTELSWTTGVGGMVHHIYFSEDQTLVDARDMSVATMYWPVASFDPGELVIGTTYYWAVDEFGPAGTFAGPTWSFSPFSFDPIAITDPSLLIHYTFDEIQGGLINDLSGHENYGVVNGNAQLANAAMQFDGKTAYVDVPASAWSTIDTQVTLAFWAYIDSATLPQNNFIFGAFSDPANNDTRVFSAHMPWGSTVYFDSSGPGYDRTSKAITTVELADAWVHWAFIKNSDTGVVSIYRNGDLWHSATDKIKPMNGAGVTKFTIGTKPALNEGWFTGMMDDVRLYNKALTGQEVIWAMNNMADVTGPNDMVQGVPNEVRDGSIAGWPDGEAPGFAIDDNSGTKFLHFAGEVSPTGIQVAPAAGLTLVTGLTLTTANDSPERDPISYEVYGSNESIDGPYELIAAGDVNDFAQEAAWPRFTKNATTIAFDNTVAYAFYQVLFPTVRNAATANSMQIAEVELIGSVLPLYFEDFESYAAGDDLEGLGGWAGWGGPAASAPVSDAFALSGSNSVEIIGSADLVQEFELAGGKFVLSAMQYIPSGTTGTTYFILMNQYGAVNDWSIQTEFHLDTGEIKPWSGAQSDVTIQYDKWVELKYEVDLDANTVLEYYDGVQIDSRQWDDGASGVFGAIDLFGNNASSVYYDNILVD